MASRVKDKELARAEREQRAAEQHARERRTRRLWQLGVAVGTAAVVVIIAILVGTAGKSKVAAPTIFSGIPQHGNVLGNPSAPVTMTEFADLQCPVCREYTAKVMPSLVQRYVRAGKVKMVFQDLAFLGDDSIKAGRAAAAAGAQNKLWQFADVAYADQGVENSGYVTDGWIRSVAGKVPGLDVNRLMSDRNAPSTLQAIEQARTQGKSLGVDSTPTFFLQRGSGPIKQLNWSDFTPGSFTPSIDSALAG
jgi:protein-disulfide isomerase